MKKNKGMEPFPELQGELCNSCKFCMIACPCGGIVFEGDKIKLVQNGDCMYCGVCEAVCPKYAIHCEYTIVVEG